MFKEFRDFAMKGNMVDLAIGVKNVLDPDHLLSSGRIFPSLIGAPDA